MNSFVELSGEIISFGYILYLTIIFSIGFRIICGVKSFVTSALSDGIFGLIGGFWAKICCFISSKYFSLFSGVKMVKLRIKKIEFSSKKSTVVFTGHAK